MTAEVAPQYPGRSFAAPAPRLGVSHRNDTIRCLPRRVPMPATQVRRARAGDRGALGIGLVIVLLACCLVSLGLLRLMSEISQSLAHAQSVADLSALAGALHGEAGARRVARANQAVLTSFQTADHEAAVVIRVGRAHANATARAVPVPPGPPLPP